MQFTIHVKGGDLSQKFVYTIVPRIEAIVFMDESITCKTIRNSFLPVRNRNSIMIATQKISGFLRDTHELFVVSPLQSLL